MTLCAIAKNVWRESTSHCLRCGKSLLANVDGDICHDCICAGLEPFRSDLKKIISGLGYPGGLGRQSGLVKVNMIAEGFQRIQKFKNGECCETCIACRFLGKVERFSKNLPVNPTKFFADSERLRKILWGAR